MKKRVDPFIIHSIEKIVQILWDGGKYSAYQITKQMDITIATVIEHLNKLAELKYIKVEDATKGNLKRYHYTLTEQGREKYMEFVNKELRFLTRLGRSRPANITSEKDDHASISITIGGKRTVLWDETVDEENDTDIS
jgi:DNA-binding MarR family transcriptional regulator